MILAPQGGSQKSKVNSQQLPVNSQQSPVNSQNFHPHLSPLTNVLRSEII
ncbi:hypothetical protein H6G04_07280 [Calothrix membranacea FACHB-236]|nr:hypothetical protein [Calothrix membranacea FACHB-236]